MESSCCSVPEGLQEAGYACLQAMRTVRDSVPACTQLRAQLELLTRAHSASLHSALDYHTLADLDEHDMMARRTHAVLSACSTDLHAHGVPPGALDDALRSLSLCSQLCSLRPGALTPVPSVRSWNDELRRHLRREEGRFEGKRL